MNYYKEIEENLDSIYNSLLKIVSMSPDEYGIRSENKIWIPIYNRFITVYGDERVTNAHTYYRKTKMFAGSSMAGASLKDLVYNTLPNYWSDWQGSYKHRIKIIKKLDRELKKITIKRVLEAT
jgi:hypothetical protein